MCTQISLERSSRGRGGATRTRLSSESISRSFAEVIVSVWTHLGSLPACGAAGSCARRRRTAPSHRPLTRARGTQREVVVFPPSSSSPRAGAYTRETIGASPWYPVELTRGRSPPVFRANSTSGRAGARPLGVPSASLKMERGKVSQNCDQLCFSRFEPSWARKRTTAREVDFLVQVTKAGDPRSVGSARAPAVCSRPGELRR